jgi:hypothetical protein
MVSRKLVALAVLACVPMAARAEEPENPYKKAQKGQWATYKMTIKLAGNNVDGTMKQTVTEKDDKSVTLEIVTNVFGNEMKQTQKIDLTKPFNPLAGQQLPPGADSKIEKKDSGKETIEVAGKKQETEWTKYKISVSAMGQMFDGDVKVWLAKDLPLGGMAKMEMKMAFGGMDMEMAMNMDKHGKD